MSSSAGGGHRGERRTSECPASDVMGIRFRDSGKSVRWTDGVQAPAARTRRVHEMVVWCWMEVLRRVMVESAPDEERVMEIGVAGWWRCTLRDWQDDMRKRQRRRGSLLRKFSKLSMDSCRYAMGRIWFK